ncbi:MAG: HAMP domain-containing histidine kinase [Rhodospirillales bacterium]|nr:HAMP domain-containing histidine kinase [Rhodospirillales bacterium]
MDHSKLLRTSTFRLSLSYLAIFTLSAATLLAVVYWTTASFIERQIRETIDAEITGLSEQYRERGLGGLVEIISERSARERDKKTLYLLTDNAMRPLAGNLLGWPEVKPDEAGWLTFPVQTLQGKRSEIADATARSFLLPGGFRLLVGRSLQDGEQLKRVIAQAIGWGIAVTVLLGGLGGVFMSRQLLQRVEAINRTVRRIMGGDMSQRMARSGTEDEFDQLVDNLNAMLDQIERLFESIRTVTDNVAHDLRTPLNRLRSRIDLALLGEADVETCRRTLEETMADADHLLATFNALLTIAEAEAGARSSQLSPLDLVPLVRDVFELYEPVAEEKGVAVALEAADEVMVQGDRHLLSQAVANLLDNAVKYTPPEGRIRVSVTAGAQGPELVVADNGPGIPAESRDKVLERFTRLDATRSTPGNGLGLSLVDAVARLHRAKLVLGDNEPGLTVRLAFAHPNTAGPKPKASLVHKS